MTCSTVTAGSLEGLLAASDGALADALARSGEVDLVVPDRSWAQERKRMLRTKLPTGVHVLTYEDWVDGLWDFHGDGRRRITALQRGFLLRPLVQHAGLLGASPSPRFLEELGRFAAEAVALPGGSGASAHLDASETRLMALVGEYARELEQRGLVEQAQQEAGVVRALEGGLRTRPCPVVLERPDLARPHRRVFVEALAKLLPVTVLEQELTPAPGTPAAARAGAGGGVAGGLQEGELDALARQLYSGAGGLEATGAVRVGEAWGAHALPAMLVELVEGFLDGGARPGEVAVVLPDVADAYPHAFDEFARAGVPFSARFSLPFVRTSFGAAFCELMGLSAETGAEAAGGAAEPDRGAHERLADFAATPYAGIEGRDARALQMRWRECAGSTPEARLHDITCGFTQGNAKAAQMAERLRPLAELLEADLATRARLMFAHLKDAGPEPNLLVDDQAAVRALLGYVEACAGFGAEPDSDEVARLPVALERAFGDAQDAVAFVSAGSWGLARAGYVVMGELDAAHFPMARDAGAFDALLAKLGIPVVDESVFEQRLMFRNVLESCERGAAFCRSTHDSQGAESCQSALWDELMTCYRSAGEDESGLPVQQVPSALEAHALKISEAAVFEGRFGNAAGVRRVRSVRRGQLENPADVEYLAHDLANREIPFSPTGIEDYYRCPYRWFACRRVGYNGMDGSFDAAAQGNLAHATLERFYKNLKAGGMQRVTPENLETARALVSDALDAQVKRDVSRARSGVIIRTEQDRQLIEEIRAMLEGLVERDATFLPGFVPSYFELTLGKGTGEMLRYGGVAVRGKVDRIDVDERGNAVIIDYKLSGLSAGYGLRPDQELPGRIQTDIYAVLVQRHFDLLGVPLRVVGSVYRSYSRNCLRGVYSRSIDWGPDEQVSLKRDALPREGHDETYDEYLAHVEAEVASCMERLEAGHIEPEPLGGEAGVCDYCKARSFCPVGGGA